MSNFSIANINRNLSEKILINLTDKTVLKDLIKYDPYLGRQNVVEKASSLFNENQFEISQGVQMTKMTHNKGYKPMADNDSKTNE